MIGIFSADSHGNMAQVRKVLETGKRYSADLTLLGGDITPRGYGSEKEQKKFVEKEFVGLIREYLPKNLFIITGNLDWDEWPELLKKYEGELYSFINLKQKQVGDYNIAGFSSEDSEKELTSIAIPENTICVFHTPPYNTVLDMINSKRHVGSEEIRAFIEQKQPLLTLHGHIHETVDVSGKFYQTIGRTTCASVGNYDHSEKAAMILFDTGNLSKIERILV
jgi:Icc-related predicted phosphoesterase